MRLSMPSGFSRLRSLSFLSFFIIVIGGGVSFADNDLVWDESFYTRFDHASFKLYEHANTIIDFKNIDYPLLNAAVFYETNRVREELGEEPLRHSMALEKAAMLHSRDMAEKGFFSHQNPYDAQKKTPLMRMALFGIEEGYQGENITEAFGIQYEPGSQIIPPEDARKLFRNYQTGRVIEPHTYNSFAEAVVNGWMNSAPHRANILNPRFKYLGCGTYHYENKSFYRMDQFKVTQNFASEVPE